jgi:hypothetical protein
VPEKIEGRVVAIADNVRLMLGIRAGEKVVVHWA